MTDDSTPTTGEGMSTPKKVAAGAAVGVAIPAAVTVAKKLLGDDEESGGQGAGAESGGGGQSRSRSSSGSSRYWPSSIDRRVVRPYTARSTTWRRCPRGRAPER